MIDVENIIFTNVATAVRAAFSGISVYGEYVEAPAAFPCVTIVEADNAVYERTRDLNGIEHHAAVMYEVNVYTNDAQAKKTKAKAIANVIDNVMSPVRPHLTSGILRLTAAALRFPQALHLLSPLIPCFTHSSRLEERR